jgi:hypothetical protein
MNQPRKRFRRWTRDEVLNEIRNLSDRSAKVNQREFPTLYGAAVRHFKNWKGAITAAGLTYESITKRKPTGYWTREKVIQTIQSLETKHSSAVRKSHSDLYNAALRLFRSWKAAVVAAGYNYEEVRKGWVQDKVDPFHYRNRK